MVKLHFMIISGFEKHAKGKIHFYDEDINNKLIWRIKDNFFKGIFYEYIVLVGKTEVKANDTRDLKIDSSISIKIKSENSNYGKGM